MENTVKLPVFKGFENEDPDQFWFITRAIWEVQGVTNDHIKNETLVGALQYHVLTWYIKYCFDNRLATLEETKVTLNKEFSKPKSDSESVIGFK